jgi:hypothetical protein
MKLIKYNIDRDKGDNIRIKSIIGSDTSETCEYISDLTGTFITTLYEIDMNKCPTVYSQVHMDKQFGEYHNNKIFNICNKDVLYASNAERLYLINVASCLSSGYIFRLIQIDKYDWIHKNNIDFIKQRMSIIKLSNQSRFEVRIIYDGKYKGDIDIIDNGNMTVYEIKFVSEVKKEHIIQLWLYGCGLIKKNDKYKDYKYKLFNVRSGEIINVIPDIKYLNDVLLLLTDKIIEHGNDDEFIKKCIKQNTGSIYIPTNDDLYDF